MKRTRSLTSSSSCLPQSFAPVTLGQPVRRASRSSAGGGRTPARSLIGWDTGQSQQTCAKCATSLPQGQ
eukprot:12471022-Alexandrium_andersonii.AAC.1